MLTLGLMFIPAVAWSQTYNPSYSPTYGPTYSPSYSPTYSPSYNPTYSPTYTPTYAATYTATYNPPPPPPLPSNDDEDYDRLNAAQEDAQGTPKTVPWALALVSGPEAETEVNTLNDLGQLARVTHNPVGGELRVQFLDGGVWVDGGSLGNSSEATPVAPGPGQVGQNNFGLVAALIGLAGGSSELRVLDADGTMYTVNFGEVVSSPILHRVTDSGFVYGGFLDAAGVTKAFQWRNQQLLVHDNLDGELLLADGNERGEMIAHFETTTGAFDGRFWNGASWQSVNGTVLAMNNRGQALIDRLGSAYLWKNGVDTALNITLAGYDRAALNDLGQILLYESATPGSSALFVESDGTQHTLDPETNANYGERAVLGAALNDVGEAVGRFSATQPIFDSSGTVELSDEAFSWRGGAYVLVGGIYDDSRLRAITNSGHIAVRALEVVEQIDPVTLVSTYVAELRVGILSPQNDSDGNLLPDDWEMFHQVGSAIPPPGDVPDPDGDGLANLGEYLFFTDPHDTDSDDDSLSDSWEVLFGHDPMWADDASEDVDQDGLSATQEEQAGTDPLDADSDDDGLSDSEEINTHGTDPLDADSDDDGLSDGAEINIHTTDPLLPDTDGDGQSDEVEVRLGTNPNDITDYAGPRLLDEDADGLTIWQETIAGTDDSIADTDADGLDDFQELRVKLTHPLFGDTDGDGIKDGQEDADGTNPFDPTVFTPMVDTDGDGLSDADELSYPFDISQGIIPLDPNEWDDDGDGVPAGWEVANGFLPGFDDGFNQVPAPDADSDGLTDVDEYISGTNPREPDSDFDGVLDSVEIGDELAPGPELPLDHVVTTSTGYAILENSVYSYATLQSLYVSGDAFNITDPTSPLSYPGATTTNGLEPLDPDTDGDFVPDGSENGLFWVEANGSVFDETTSSLPPSVLDPLPPGQLFETYIYGFDPLNSSDGLSDADGDGLPLGLEILLGLDSTKTDSDGDGVADPDENPYDLPNRSDFDSDLDGVPDALELHFALDHRDRADGAYVDLEGDDLVAYMEVAALVRINVVDTDGDGLTDGEEIWGYQTDPAAADTDGDGIDDLAEILAGTNPVNALDETIPLDVPLSATSQIPGAADGLNYAALGAGNGDVAYPGPDPTTTGEDWNPDPGNDGDPPIDTGNPANLEVYTRLEDSQN